MGQLPIQITDYFSKISNTTILKHLFLLGMIYLAFYSSLKRYIHYLINLLVLIFFNINLLNNIKFSLYEIKFYHYFYLKQNFFLTPSYSLFIIFIIYPSILIIGLVFDFNRCLYLGKLKKRKFFF